MIRDTLESLIPGRSRFHAFICVTVGERPAQGVCLCGWCWRWRMSKLRVAIHVAILKARIWWLQQKEEEI